MPDSQLTHHVANLHDDRVELIISPVNLGCGGGRRLLAQQVASPFIMMLDDDMYLTRGAIGHGLEVLRRNSVIGAISMPQYDLQGRMVSPGGKSLVIRNGVMLKRHPRLDFQADFIEVQELNAGAMLYRTEMNESFSWDPQMYDFEDEDKSLQIIRDGRWKQAIVPRGRLIHDRSWLGHNPNYERQRFDGLAWQREYRLFRAKWGLRLDLRSHVLYELVYPTLTLTRCQWLVSAPHRLVEMRIKTKLQRLQQGSETA
jgi:hypothetical protein